MTYYWSCRIVHLLTRVYPDIIHNGRPPSRSDIPSSKCNPASWVLLTAFRSSELHSLSMAFYWASGIYTAASCILSMVRWSLTQNRALFATWASISQVEVISFQVYYNSNQPILTSLSHDSTTKTQHMLVRGKWKNGRGIILLYKKNGWLTCQEDLWTKEREADK